MADTPGPATGTIRPVSPRARDALPPALEKRLAEAKARRDSVVGEAEEQFRAEVVAALAHGSVRRVAAAASLAPSTVLLWSKGRTR